MNEALNFFEIVSLLSRILNLLVEIFLIHFLRYENASLDASRYSNTILLSFKQKSRTGSNFYWEVIYPP